MPKETRPSTHVNASPYPSTTKTKKIKKIMSKWNAKSVYKKVAEEKCSICMETPHNGVILQCSNAEKGCRPYMCDTSYPHSNCLNKFLQSSTSTLCPLCGGEVGGNKWTNVKEATRCFMNSIPRRCPVETCEFTGNYAELENHASLEHPSVKPSVETLCEKTLRIRI
ncbi:hypothetical protein Vadar_028833 [Vaccinium darrowii]|uniref:Uncharacterized protein n=1 Tax=Vaccinium darrowii TaxID=229202 RepID=A0ACB7Y9L3_9ERIC|nr:hypothetical protein Vadar_028833 [Vaccinium darrowii]